MKIRLNPPYPARIALVVALALSLPLAAAANEAFAQFLDAAYRKHTDFEASLATLATFDRDALSPDERLSYDLFEWYLVDQAFARALVLGERRPSDVPYDRWLRHHTTTSMTAREWFDIFTGEVARNRADVDRLLAEIDVGGKTLAEQMAVVAQIGRQRTAESGRSVADEMQEYVDAAAAALRPLFGRYPSDPIVVTPVADLLSIAGLRMGSEAQGRPNQLQILPGRDGVPYHLRLTVAHHEGFPGHYVQESIQAQLRDLPAFRAQGGFTAYTESWALYAEQLAWDAGLFDGRDPLHALGFFVSKLNRSTKALADVGLNGMGWSPGRCCTLLIETAGVDDREAREIVDRMGESPGAATASYAGYVCFVSLRARMETALGDAFCLADFHRRVLEDGPMPMEILDRVIEGALLDPVP